MFTIEELERAAEIVHSTLPATPQIRWPLLCERVNADVWVKQENHTPTGAFKIRGALLYMAELQSKHPEIKGVIAATRGNFGQSVALAGVRAGLRTVIVVPHGNSLEQNAAMRGWGAEVVEFGTDIINQYADRVVTVSDSEIMEAMRIYFQATHNVAEGAAAAPLAALLQDQKIMRNKRVALIHSGCNIDRDRFVSVLAERL
jgi:threonine dehydratase